MTNNQENSNIQMKIAIISLLSAFGVAIIGLLSANWGTIFSNNKSQQKPLEVSSSHRPGDIVDLVTYLVDSGFKQKGFNGGVIIGQTSRGYGKDIMVGTEEKNIQNRGIYTPATARYDGSVYFQIPLTAKQFEGYVGLSSGEPSCLDDGSKTAKARVYIFVDQKKEFEKVITADSKESSLQEFDISLQNNQEIELRVKSERNEKSNHEKGHCNEIVWGNSVLKF